MKLNKSFHIYGRLQRIMYLKVILILVSIFIFQNSYAQADANPDFLRSVGKIYVVAAVTLVILLTLFIYLIIIDRKISRLEKRQKNE